MNIQDKRDLASALHAIRTERAKQFAKGYSAEKDDEQYADFKELACGAAASALYASGEFRLGEDVHPANWEKLRPHHDARDDLIRAAALIVAALTHMARADRRAKRQTKP